ncbi:hypothetical protein Ddye_018817 [Dipteronia dyeriana]|uniref:Mediator complex subunit 15 KIX domain-containing protein n=1 Tax=Dipteronia dyeriana TaxID=168575 RepID=A0AAD9UBR5_9ROSI|nr:hypothetical protein Ddye_018817 [Dipteronia dyeriana]
MLSMDPYKYQAVNQEENLSHFCNLKPTPQDDHEECSIMYVPDWRNELLPHLREKVVSRIRETLEKHFPCSISEEVSGRIMKMALRFEEKVFSCASSWSDYLRKISLKMVSLKFKGPYAIRDSAPSNYVDHDSYKAS